jgi:hypothetical protein
MIGYGIIYLRNIAIRNVHSEEYLMVAVIGAKEVANPAEFLYMLVRVGVHEPALPTLDAKAKAARFAKRVKPFAYTNGYNVASSMMSRSSKQGGTSRLAIVYSPKAIKEFEERRARGEV